MLISVIVPIYNTEEYIETCILSIIKQSYTNLEILLIDDGSEDKSGSICDEYEHTDKRIRVIHTTNHGVSYARNIGIKESHGEYVTFVDSDDTVEIDYIKAMVNACKKSEDLVVSNIKDIDCIKKKSREKRLIDTYRLSGDFREDLCEFHELTSGPCIKLYKREILINNKILFDEQMNIGEDLVFNYSFNAYVKNYAYVDESNYNYFHRNKSSLSRIYNKGYIDDCIKAYNKCIELYSQNRFRNSNDMVVDHAVGALGLILKKRDLTYTEYCDVLKRLYDSIDFNIYIRNFSLYGWRSYLINVLFKYRLINFLWLASKFK